MGAAEDWSRPTRREWPTGITEETEDGQVWALEENNGRPGYGCDRWRNRGKWLPGRRITAWIVVVRRWTECGLTVTAAIIYV